MTTSNVRIVVEDNCYYMTQDLTGLGIYDRAKAIVNFCDKDTKELEKLLDRAIMDILKRNGINIPNTSKSVLKCAFDTLNGKGKDIKIEDLYAITKYNCQKIAKSPLFTIYLEDDNFLQIGIGIEEVNI